MDIMIADSTGYALGYLTSLSSFDLDTTQTYDFEVQMSLAEYRNGTYDYGYRVYCPGTEFGGRIQDVQIVSAESNVIIMGDTWRGMLRKKVILPDSGQDYKIVSGEANEIIKNLVGNQFGELFTVSDEDSGYTIDSYQFELYTTLEEGICAMLKTVNAKLSILYSTKLKQVVLSAQPSVLHTNYTDDQLHITTRIYRRGINHLICLGQGELQERTRIDLYVGADGSIGKTQYFTGVDERVEVYDYPSAESEETLELYGIKRLREKMDYDSATLDVEDVTDMDVGDIVSCKEMITGMTVEEAVTGLTLTISHGVPTITYKLGDDC